MQIIKSQKELIQLILQYKQNKMLIGFVPTMGALHKGHLSLVESSNNQCDITICSIFVNPTQFNNLSDLEKYPRTFDADCQLLKKSNCDVVFAPEINEMYSEKELLLKKQGIEDKSWMDGKNVDFENIATVMEGAFRPGHFNGVAQVVSKLFKIVEPDKAFFGQKDFQQLAIIKSMVKQMGFKIEIVACPTLREANGLAMSSRNERLTSDQRQKAGLISKTLYALKELYKNKSVTELKTFVAKQIKAEPQMQLEYFEIADAETLQPINSISSGHAVACIALKMGEVRLIDNLFL